MFQYKDNPFDNDIHSLDPEQILTKLFFCLVTCSKQMCFFEDYASRVRGIKRQNNSY